MSEKMRYMIGHSKVYAMMTGFGFFSLLEGSDVVTAHYTDGQTESAAVAPEYVRAIIQAVEFQQGKSKVDEDVDTFALLSAIQKAARS